MKNQEIGPAVYLVVGVCLTAIMVGCGRSAEQANPPPQVQEPQSLTEVFQRHAAEQSGTTVVATVSGVEITRAELDREAQNLTANVQQRLGPERAAQLQTQIRKQALESLIVQQLLKRAISNENIEVTDAEVSNRIAELAATLPVGVTLEQQLARYNVTPEQLSEAIKFDMAVGKLMEKHTPTDLVPSEEEIEQFYEQYQDQFTRPETVRARHILIQVSPDDPPEVKETKRKQAEEIRQNLLEGADFAELAREYSDCPSKRKGGDLGEISRGQTVPNFEQAAFSQKVGEIGPVVETRFGYHIIQVTDHKPPQKLSLDQVHETISRAITQRKQRQAAANYIEKLRQAAQIEYKTDTP